MTRSEITWGAGRVVLQVRSAVFRSLRFLAECPRRCEGQAIFAVLPGISPRSALAYYLSEVPPLNFLSVASSKTPDSIRHMLGREIEAWAKKGVKVSVRESLKGELLVFHCEIQGSTDSVRQEVLREIKDSVANELSHIIIDEYEALLVNRLVDENYAYLSSRDRGVIKRKVAAALDGKSRQGSGFRDGAERSRRKSRVWARLAEYLEKENEIVLEGFITFRLKEYLEGLFDTVEEVAEDHLTEREYREFLRLLRHFMGSQRNKTVEVNVVRGQDGYTLYDDKMEPVEGEVGRFLARPPQGMDLGVDDIIVSAVVTLAPERVIWHGSKNDSPCYDLIHDLFEDNVVSCPGCPLEKTPAPT
jgi:putative sporulation protein YtxC